MLLTCLRLLGPATTGDGEALACAAEHVAGLQPDIRTLAEAKKQRFVYLGSGPLEGLAHESALKMLELTAGEVVTYFDSPLGFRHGPKSALDGDTLAVVYVSTDPYTRRYDLDIIAEIRAQLGQDAVVVISAEPIPATTGPHSCCRASTVSTTLGWPFPTWCSPSIWRCSPRWNTARRPTIPSRPVRSTASCKASPSIR